MPRMVKGGIARFGRMSEKAIVLVALVALVAMPVASAHPDLGILDELPDITVLDMACVDPDRPAVSASGGCAQTECAVPSDGDEICMPLP